MFVRVRVRGCYFFSSLVLLVLFDFLFPFSEDFLELEFCAPGFGPGAVADGLVGLDGLAAFNESNASKACLALSLCVGPPACAPP